MSSNSFSSLENISILIKSLINSNKDALPLKHISKLVDDLTNLLNETDYYDMEIEVGENDDIKIFKAHSNILKSRFSHFKAALSDGCVRITFMRIKCVFPNKCFNIVKAHYSESLCSICKKFFSFTVSPL